MGRPIGAVLNRQSAEILVVLPTLGNRLETLKETLLSIDVQREQVELKLVVVAPLLAREARALARSFGALIVDDPGLGISEAINCGIAARTTEVFYAWMGDDDLYRPGGLLTLRSLFERFPSAIVSFGGCDYIDPNGKILGTNKAGNLATWLLSWGPDLIPHPGSMIRFDAIEETGPFDNSLKYAMDLDMFLRLRKIGKFVSTRTVVSAFRWHPNSLTVASRSSSSKESESVKQKYLPALLKPFSFIWTLPVRWASTLAAKGLNKKALYN